MTTTTTEGQRVALIAIKAPPEIFDHDNAVVYRRKRVPATRMDTLRNAKSTAEGYESLAYIFPKWENVLDVETGEPLPNPEDEPAVFERLDITEQLPWLNQTLMEAIGLAKK